METNTASEYKHSLKRLTASVIHICSGLAERVSEGPDRENRLLEFQMMNMLHTLVQLHVQSQRKQNSIACMDAVTGKSAAGSEQNSICQQHEMVPEMEQFQALLARKPLQNRYCAERTLESLNYLSSCYMQPANKSEVCKESSNYQKESGSRDQKIHESFEDFEIIKDEEEKQKDREYMEWQHMQDWQVVEEKNSRVFPPASDRNYRGGFAGGCAFQNEAFLYSTAASILQ